MINNINSCILFKECTVYEELKSLKYEIRRYNKNSYILEEGDIIKSLGIIISGNAKIVKYDEEGDENLIGLLQVGELFAEVFVINKNPLYINVIALNDVEVLFIDYNSLLTNKPLTRNLLEIIAEKNLTLNQRINHMSKHNIREKILSFLYSFKTKNISINMDRNELANYLGIDRSALSRELSNMKSEKIIDYYKNDFRLL